MDAEAVRDRGVNLLGLAGDAAALVRAEGADGAHVVGAVGELDEDDPDVRDHGHDHLAEVLGLRLAVVGELQLVELRNARDQVRDGVAVELPELVTSYRGVLHHVVEQRGHDGLAVKVEVGQDAGNRDRMGNIRLAARAGLPLMGILRGLICGVNPLNLI